MVHTSLLLISGCESKLGLVGSRWSFYSNLAQLQRLAQLAIRAQACALPHFQVGKWRVLCDCVSHFFCLCNIDAWLQPVSRHFKKRFYLPAHKSFSSLSACSDLFVMPHEKKSSAHKEKGDEEHTGLCGGCVTFTLMCLSSDWQEIIDKCVYCLFFFFAVIAGQKQ